MCTLPRKSACLEGAEARLGLDDRAAPTGPCARRAAARRDGRCESRGRPTPPANVAVCRPFGPPAFSVADVMRFAGASRSAGRSTCTFSTGVERGHRRAVGAHREVDGSRRSTLRVPPSAVNCTTAFSTSLRSAAACGRPAHRSDRCRAPDIALRAGAPPEPGDPAVAAHRQLCSARVVRQQLQRRSRSRRACGLRRRCGAFSTRRT